MSGPDPSAVQALFAYSRNLCFFEGCDEKLTDPAWSDVNGEIVQISGDGPAVARFDPDEAAVDRQAYDNLLLLCPKHHKLVDRLAPSGFPPDVLRHMRTEHLRHATSGSWCSAEQAEDFARRAIAQFEEQRAASSGLHIVRARYGAEPTYNDVTATVRSLAVGGWLELAVTNEALGGDPVFGREKRLEIVFTFHGVESTASWSEGETARLPLAPDGTKAP